MPILRYHPIQQIHAAKSVFVPEPALFLRASPATHDVIVLAKDSKETFFVHSAIIHHRVGGVNTSSSSPHQHCSSCSSITGPIWGLITGWGGLLSIDLSLKKYIY